MDQDDTLQNALRDKLGAQDLLQRLRELEKQTGGLLDERALLALLADEEGITRPRLQRLSELGPSLPVFTACVVDSIEPVREFRARDRLGRLRKLRVSDSSGSLTLTLWDDETGLVEQLAIRPGSRIRILSAVFKTTRFGPELHIGRLGFIVPEGDSEPASPPVDLNIGQLASPGQRVNVKGVILSLGSSGRGRGKTTTLRLFDGTGECEITIPQECPAPLSDFAVGSEMEISNAVSEVCQGNALLRCDAKTTIRIV